MTVTVMVMWIPKLIECLKWAFDKKKRNEPTHTERGSLPGAIYIHVDDALTS